MSDSSKLTRIREIGFQAGHNANDSWDETPWEQESTYAFVEIAGVEVYGRWVESYERGWSNGSLEPAEEVILREFAQRLASLLGHPSD